MADQNTTLKTKEQWDTFVKSDLLNFLVANNLQKLTVDDGSGKKGVIKVSSAGEFKIQITNNETM
jgi:hypothetical protein